MGHSHHEALLQQEAEQILNTGVRDLWYPVAPSWQVGNAPIGVTRLRSSSSSSRRSWAPCRGRLGFRGSIGSTS